MKAWRWDPCPRSGSRPRRSTRSLPTNDVPQQLRAAEGLQHPLLFPRRQGEALRPGIVVEWPRNDRQKLFERREITLCGRGVEGVLDQMVARDEQRIDRAQGGLHRGWILGGQSRVPALQPGAEAAVVTEHRAQ